MLWEVQDALTLEQAEKEPGCAFVAAGTTEETRSQTRRGQTRSAYTQRRGSARWDSGSRRGGYRHAGTDVAQQNWKNLALRSSLLPRSGWQGKQRQDFTLTVEDYERQETPG
ncbi:MAG: hypothetical protein MZV70_36215 [Desulfobacterales bacterium]|nr:hypothetical protein [Desulfobacterales bacterium]